MPIYEYQCQSCNKTFDHHSHTMNPPAAAECPGCKSKDTRRRLSVFAVAASSPNPAGAGGHQHSGMCGCGRRAGSCSN